MNTSLTFTIDGCDGAGKVCLVFPPKSEGAQVDDTGNIHLELAPPEPQVWLLDRAFEWHFLASNFPTILLQTMLKKQNFLYFVDVLFIYSISCVDVFFE